MRSVVVSMVSEAEIAKYLGSVDFPATRDEIVQEVARQGAPEDVLKALRRMPPVDYRNRAEVLRSAAVKEDLPPSEHAARARDHTHQRIAEPLREPPPDNG
jgi:hypothetical protein